MTFASSIALAMRAKSPYAVDLTCAVLYGMLMESNDLRFLISVKQTTGRSVIIPSGYLADEDCAVCQKYEQQKTAEEALPQS